MKIAMFAHSTNPRGGVVHALELCEALAAKGHEPVLFAPDASGAGFYREASFELRPWKAEPAPRDVAKLVALRRAEMMEMFTKDLCDEFDLFHAQDSISGNGLADLREAGRISGFLRTIHHLDVFADALLARLQARSINAAEALLTVSHAVQAELAANFGRKADLVGNGVDAQRFSPKPDATDAALRAKLNLGSGPVVLSLGGIEKRKNTLGILRGFCALRQDYPNAVLVIAGGVSLLDHEAYQAEFAAALAESALPPHAVRILGRIAQEDMPALYRLADVLVFPSLHEGFGLAVLEAMACGVPVMVPRLAPFTEYLTEADAAWCEPENTASALRKALEQSSLFRQRGFAVAARWRWADVAAAHLPVYEKMRSLAHA